MSRNSNKPALPMAARREPAFLPAPPAPAQVVMPSQFPAQTVQAGQSSLEQELMLALKRCWPLALGLGLFAAIVGGTLAWYFVPRSYTARAVLQLSSEPSPGLFATHETHTDDPASFQRTQTALLKSREVLQLAMQQSEVIEQPELSERYSAAWLGESLKIDSNQGPELLTLTLSGTHPKDLPILVNAVANAFLEEMANRDRFKQSAQLDKLQENYRRLGESLRRKRSLLRELEANLNIEPAQLLSMRYQAALTETTAGEKELWSTRMALKKAEKELGALQDGNEAGAELSLDPQLLIHDPSYQALLQQKSLLQQEITRIKNLAAPGLADKLTQDQTNQLAGIERSLEMRRKELVPMVRAQKRANLQMNATVLREQQNDLTHQVQRQKEEVQRLAAAVRQPSKSNSEVDVLHEEVTQIEQVYRKVGEQRDLLKMEPLPAARVTLLEEATVPRSMDVKRQGKLAGMCAVGLFVLAFAGVGLREYRLGRVDVAGQIVHGQGVNVLGALPTLSAAPLLSPSSLNGNFYEQMLMTVSVDALRDRLITAQEAGSMRVLLITSAAREEGQTSLALHLAASLVRAGRKVLVLDGCLLQPRSLPLFDAPQAELGFSDVLGGETPLVAAIQPTPLSGLSMMPAGRWSNDNALILANGKGTRTFDQLKKQYDHVIVVTSPVLTGADALLLCKHADAVILSAQREVSRLPPIQEAAQLLTQTGARLVGTVVTGLKV